jgi:putative tryptophan/tyrosine transport system substrate-binding protein
MTTRRTFIAGLGAAATWPLAARGQQGERMRRVGVLSGGSATNTGSQSRLAVFIEGLRELGWIEGKNLQVDVRWSAADATLAKIYAAQLIGLMPDVIVVTSTLTLKVVREATATVPVVFIGVSDPVAQGFVASMTSPGGNLTGFSQFEFAVGGKWLDLLKEISPGLERVGVMFNPDTAPQSTFFMRSVEAAATALGVRAIAATVRNTIDIESAVDRLGAPGKGGLMLPTDGFTSLNQSLIIELATRFRLPAISADSTFPKDGGLMYYGVGAAMGEAYRQAAGYVDRIFKGAKPRDLPVQAPTKYDLIINSKTAKAFGLNIPLPLAGLADEIIE